MANAQVNEQYGENKEKEVIVAWLLPRIDRARALMAKEALKSLVNGYEITIIEEHTIRIKGVMDNNVSAEIGRQGLRIINEMPRLEADRLPAEVKIIYLPMEVHPTYSLVDTTGS